MTAGALAPLPLFVGPALTLLGGLLVVLLVLTVVRFLFSVGVRLLAVGAVVLGALWVLGFVTF